MVKITKTKLVVAGVATTAVSGSVAILNSVGRVDTAVSMSEYPLVRDGLVWLFNTGWQIPALVWLVSAYVLWRLVKTSLITENEFLAQRDRIEQIFKHHEEARKAYTTRLHVEQLRQLLEALAELRGEIIDWAASADMVAEVERRSKDGIDRRIKAQNEECIRLLNHMKPAENRDYLTKPLGGHDITQATAIEHEHNFRENALQPLRIWMIQINAMTSDVEVAINNLSAEANRLELRLGGLG